MASSRSAYLCQSCGYSSPKWLGRCPQCDAWDSLLEEARPSRSGRAAKGRRVDAAKILPLADLDDDALIRFSSHLPLLDRVLGGGLVAGAAILLAGEPGIGKSTLLLQLGDALGRHGGKVLYASAEESPRQLRLRAERLRCRAGELAVASETGLEALLEAVLEHRPTVLLVDSIQALRSRELESTPGSIGQVRHCADRLVEIAKKQHMTLFLVGHVTKEGSIAGPKSLEHLVDTVLTFEGEGGAEHRILRAQKNRFGPTGEVAMYEMHDSGLIAVEDPSRVLLARRRANRPGSSVFASMHGSRPLLVELQALVQETSFPSPRRMSVGLDANRVTLLIAVLERFGHLSLAQHDLFLNAVGGLQPREPAADLAVAAAILSASFALPLPESTAFFGEVGLLGEVRSVSRTESRLREIAALGFSRAFVPGLERVQTPKGLTVVEIEDVSELTTALFGADGDCNAL